LGLPESPEECSSWIQVRVYGDDVMSKTELVREVVKARQSFMDTLEGLTESESSISGSMGTWSVNDVVAHMVYWDEEFLRGLKILLEGGYPDYLDSDWDEVNAREVEKRKGLSLEELTGGLGESGEMIRQYLEGLGEEEFSASRGLKWKNWDVTIEWVLQGLIGHDRHHTKKMLSWRKEREQPG
jgi:uncharacterized damage-inducible protein DinB